MTTLIVSGAGGFLGKRIVRHALGSEFDQVVAITSKNASVFKEESKKLTVISIDNFILRNNKFSNDQTLINCMFPTNADGIQLGRGLNAVFDLLEHAKKIDIGRVVNVSSQSVYDPQRNQPATERDAVCLKSPYAVGKYCIEKYCEKLFSSGKFTNVRLSSLIGVGYDQRIANRMIEFALQNGKLKVIGGEQRYGLLDVEDAAEAFLVLSGARDGLWHPIYNLGNNTTVTLLELARCISSAMNEFGYSITIEMQDGGDKRNSSLDCGLFMGDFPWRPSVALRDSIYQIVLSKIEERENAE